MKFSPEFGNNPRNPDTEKTKQISSEIILCALNCNSPAWTEQELEQGVVKHVLKERA